MASSAFELAMYFAWQLIFQIEKQSQRHTSHCRRIHFEQKQIIRINLITLQ